MYNFDRNRDYLGRQVGTSATTLGISERWERVLCYSLGIFGFGWLSGLIMLLLERRNQTVQRHARQAILVFGIIGIISLVLALLGVGVGWIPILGGVAHLGLGFLGWILNVINFVLWVVFEVMAFLGPKTLFTGPRWDRYL